MLFVHLKWKQKAARALVVMGIACVLFCSPAGATDQLDLSTGLKTLLLLTEKIPNPVIVAIVFDPANPESKSDAETIRSDIDNGIGVPGGLKLTAQTVSFADFSKLSGVKVAFLTKSLPSSCFGDIGRAASVAGILTISTDLDCVKANKCVIGVVSKPRVNIYYSSAAAEAARINFPTTFIMLVNRI